MNGENESIENLRIVYDKDDKIYEEPKPVINFGKDFRKTNGKKGLTNNNNNDSNHDEYKMEMKLKETEEDPLTGGGGSTPITNNNDFQRVKWRHRFGSTNFFMVIFLIAYILQGCYFTYFVSVITTIEKLFHIKSATIALLLNFSEVGQICTSLILTYFAGRGHRPRWIACGMFLFAIAAFGSVSPHFIYRDKLYNGQHNNALASAVKQQISSDFNNITVDLSELNLCVPSENLKNNKNVSSFNGASCEFFYYYFFQIFS